ncbi:MAG: VTT domain-containing protein [Gammaproteobacteria bacterium]|nr:VTT domain-containing protein [Gammaproteobacteria bacterium]
MQIFAHYIEPLTNWLHSHPEQALLLTFFIAFLESLAIVGSIIPGSVTMTAIGILAGAGVIRIDLTFLASTTGAIVGDGVSYLLGYVYSERLTTLWPFSRYPNLLAYGQIYFEKHGGKSVLIGRFVGPLRSIIPVIAGMLHMPKWRFFLVNALSGLGWSILYVTPGILIGAASHELSPERATRLVMLVLLILVTFWLLTIGMKALFIHFNVWFQKILHQYWLQALKLPIIGACCRLITPRREPHHANTAILCLTWIVCLLGFLLITDLRFQFNLLTDLNHATHFFLQSIRTHAFECFFAIAQQSLMRIPSASLFMFITLFFMIEKDIKAIVQWGLFGFFCIVFLYVMHHLLPLHPLPRLHGILGQKPELFFPASDFTLASACYLSILFHNQRTRHNYARPLFTLLLTASLLFGGLGLLYLSDLWLSDLIASFLLACVMCISYWLIHRKTHPFYYSHSAAFALVGSGVFMTSTLLACTIHLTQTLQNHQIYFSQHIISPIFWWNQDRSLIPLYSRNRVGKITGVFNVQYVGSVNTIEQALKKQGWVTQKRSLLHTVLKHMDNRATAPLPPLADSIYLNQPPVLTMVRFVPHQPMILRFQLWHSNYHLMSLHYPIWVGHIQKIRYHKPYLLLSQDQALMHFSKELHGFTLKKLPIPMTQTLTLPHLKYMLLIQEQTEFLFPKRVDRHGNRAKE